MSVRFPALLLAALATGPLSCTAFAQQPGADESRQTIVVTANRGARPISETLSDVTVITRREIADSGAVTVPELLQSWGGVEISQNGGAGKVSGLFIRGTRTAQSIVLVDGVRLENPLSGGGNLELLSVANIDRIEIVRGPSSSLYGSGAIGGVVQIFTRQPDGPIQANGAIGFGTQSSALARAGFAGALDAAGDTRVSLSLGVDRTGGYEATNPSSAVYQADRDGNSARNVAASFSQRLNRQWTVGVNWSSNQGTSRYDDSFSTPETAKLRFVSSAGSFHVTGQVAPGWESSLRVGESRIASQYDAFVFEPVVKTQSMTWQNAWRGETGRWLFGLERTLQSVRGEGLTTGTTPYLNDARRTSSWFGGYEAQVARHLLRFNLRSDAIDQLGTHTSGSVGYGYRLDPATLLRASYGTAYRAPTFDDLFNPFGSNPLLRPERATGGEIAWERSQGASLFKATAFASRIRDAIELDGSFIPQNLDSARVQGLTLEGREQFGALTLRGNLTVQRTQGEAFDPNSGLVTTQRLSRRARQFGMLHADWRSGAWRYGVQWQFQGERIDLGSRLGSYALLNLTAAWTIDKDWSMLVRAGNVGDRHYETALGYNGAPRSLFVSFRYRL